MAEAKKCDVCSEFYEPNTVDGVQLVGHVKSHEINIRYDPTPNHDGDMAYHSKIDLCYSCIKTVLTHIITKL